MSEVADKYRSMCASIYAADTTTPVESLDRNLDEIRAFLEGFDVHTFGPHEVNVMLATLAFFDERLSFIVGSPTPRPVAAWVTRGVLLAGAALMHALPPVMRPPRAHPTTCPVCGVRIFNDVAVRGICRTCLPDPEPGGADGPI